MKLKFDPIFQPVLLGITVPGTGGGGNTSGSEGGGYNEGDPDDPLAGLDDDNP